MRRFLTRTTSFLPKLVAAAASAAVVVCTKANPNLEGFHAEQDAGAPTTTPPAAFPPGLTSSPQDRYFIKFAATTRENAPITPTPDAPPAAAPTAPAGRLILFFLPATQRWEGVSPADGPFFESLQPIASIAVGPIAEGASVAFDPRKATVFGGPLEALDGAWIVQAVLDCDFGERGHLGPGNRISKPQRVELAADRVDELLIELSDVIPTPRLPQTTTVEWITRKSTLLSRHYGRDFVLRAGVVLPYGYNDLSFDRRIWPTVYVVGGFGANHLAAFAAASALQSPVARAAVPQAVWIFLDPETPWGHAGFCDSETNGPVGRALVEEFIPFLEERFRLIAAPDARIVTGHSSGGWTAINLTLKHPDVFGACFASAPDPVDFSAFQCTDLYRDPNLFISRDGSDTPSHRSVLGPNDDRITMTVRDEIGSERAIDPSGRSGEQWASWEAMWSPFDPARNGPRPLCDPDSGEIDLVTAEAWSKHDISRQFSRDPSTIGAIFGERIRLLCGTRDSFYLNLAVARLKAKIEAWKAGERSKGVRVADGPGYIELLDGLTHDSLYPVAQIRFHQGIVEHLRAHGLAEAAPQPGGIRANDTLGTGNRPNGAGAPNRDAQPIPRPRSGLTPPS